MEKQYIVPVGVFVKDNKLLLCFKHTSSSPHCTNKWELPGGRIKFGQTYQEALLAKMKQYLGVDVKMTKTLDIIHSFTDDQSQQYFIIPALCELLSENLQVDQSKLSEAKWFSLPEIQELHQQGQLVDEMDLEIARKVLQN